MGGWEHVWILAMVERGVLIETSNPKPEIRKNAEIASDWEYSGEAK